MIAVVLAHSDGRRQNVWLGAVPRVGDNVRVLDGDTFVVEHVLWLETIRATDTNVVLVVHPSTPVPEPPPNGDRP